MVTITTEQLELVIKGLTNSIDILRTEKRQLVKMKCCWEVFRIWAFGVPDIDDFIDVLYWYKSLDDHLKKRD